MRKPDDADTGEWAGRGPVCQHLGTEEDRSSYFHEPSARHRCYLWQGAYGAFTWWQRDRIDLTHQANFCLTESHSVCPWLSISPPRGIDREGRILSLHPDVQAAPEPRSRRAVVMLTALWIRPRMAAGAIGRRAAVMAVAGWRWLRPTLARLARFLWARTKDGLLGVRHWLAELRRRDSTPPVVAEPAVATVQPGAMESAGPAVPPPEQPEQVHPEAPQPQPRPAPAVPAAGSHPRGLASPTRPGVKQPLVTWRCSACEAINAGPSQVCHTCGRPSPEVEEELTASGDELLAKGLAGLKAKNEDLAHAYFVLASEASPESELAWYWRAKTAPDLGEVIRCLECIVALNPGSTKAQNDLSWALQRQQQKQAQPVAVAAAPPQPAKPAQRPKIVGEMQWWALQAAGVCTFALSLALMIPYGLRLTDLPERPELRGLLALAPSVALPKLLVHPPNLPAFDVGPVLPLLLGLLLLHAAFVVVSGGGLGARIWTALLVMGAGGLILSFGTNSTASGLAVDLAAVAIAAVLAGDAQVVDARGDGMASQTSR